VIEKDVGKARRNDGAKTEVFQRPRRMLTAGATAEVAARQQHGGALVARLVQHKIHVQRALAVVLPRITFVQVAPLVKQVRAEAGALDRLEKLLRDDLVGVDV